MVTQSTTALAVGQDIELKQLAQRFKSTVRGGEKLSDRDAEALAQITLVTGLSPYTGEIWFIPGSGPMIGIAGARRLDQERTASKGGYSWPSITSCAPEEAGATEAELKDVVAAFRCEINDSAATADYQKLFSLTLQSMRDAGVKDPFDAAKEVCGPRPMWIGYGYAKKSEQSRMNKTQLARKRAEADALKKRIVIPFGAQLAESDVAPDYVDAQAEDVPASEKRSREQNLRELGFPAESQQPALEPEALYNEARQMIVKVKGGKEKFVGELSIDQLNYIIENGKKSEQIEAAKVVLKHDFQMEPA